MKTNQFSDPNLLNKRSQRWRYIAKMSLEAILLFVIPLNVACWCGGICPVIRSEDDDCDPYRSWVPPIAGMNLNAYQWDSDNAGSVSITTQYLDQYCGVSPSTCGTTSGKTGIRDIPGLHPGIDIGVPIGTPVYAITNGVVTFAGQLSEWGKVVMVKHNHVPTVQNDCYDTVPIISVYAHLSEISVVEDMDIRAGQVVGKSGTAGTGAHLHFQIQRYGESKPYWPTTSGNLNLCKDDKNYDNGRLCRAFQRAEQSDVISSTYQPIKTIINGAATEGNTHPDLGRGDQSSRSLQMELAGSLEQGQLVSTVVETSFGVDSSTRGGDDPYEALYDYLDRLEEEGSVMDIPDINALESRAGANDEDVQTESAEHVIDPYSIVFEGYLEIEVEDDGDERLADQAGGNWSAYFTPYELLCTPGCWWRRDMTVYYYDHKDTVQILLPGHLDNPGRVLTFEIGTYQARTRTEHNQQVTGAYYQDVYREKYGYGGRVTKRFELEDHELRHIYMGDPIKIAGVVSATTNQSGNSAPESLRNSWTVKAELSDFRVLSATVYMTLTPSALVSEPEVKSMPRLGDVNWDGEITDEDVTLIAEYTIGLTVPPPFYEIAADVDCDGDITVVDALMVAQHIHGLRDTFPCELL